MRYCRFVLRHGLNSAGVNVFCNQQSMSSMRMNLTCKHQLCLGIQVRTTTLVAHTGKTGLDLVSLSQRRNFRLLTGWSRLDCLTKVKNRFKRFLKGTKSNTTTVAINSKDVNTPIYVGLAESTAEAGDADAGLPGKNSRNSSDSLKRGTRPDCSSEEFEVCAI
jgi:hypothetical protein